MIVTNDKYETPVLCDVVGSEKVAAFLGLSYSRFYHNITKDEWKFCKYKAIDLGYEDEQEDFIPNEIHFSEEEAQKIKNERKAKKHAYCYDRYRQKCRENYKKDREKVLEEKKQYYQDHKEERCKYASEYYQLKKLGLKGRLV